MISAALHQIIEDFVILDDWEDRYVYLIDLAKKLPPVPPELKIPSHIVQGCMSTVWMVPRVENGRFYLLADSDAILVRGLIAILYAAYNDVPTPDVKTLDIAAVFKKLDLEQNLSPNRRNGFFAMVERLKTVTC